jgi:uroporphyrin-III C-methyltransferase/precorrin-2 dehydrogenase/sirohydrochlorin ferrochelatase
MGARRLATIAERMVEAGVSPRLPAVAIENATLPGERMRAGTVATIAGLVGEAGFDGPTLLIFGEVAGRAACDHDLAELRGRLAGFDHEGRVRLREEA